MFTHEIVELPEFSHIATDIGRMYVAPNGVKYPSVSTVLSMQDKAGLKAWQKRLGKIESNRIMKQSGNSGSTVHDLCEKHVMNEPIDLSKEMPINVAMFIQLRKLLDKHVDRIVAVEAPLYSEVLEVAGRVDLIAYFDGVLSIIDYKTSRREKKEDWISGYKMQMAAYSQAFFEMTGINIEQTVILMAVRSGVGTKFIAERDPWIAPFKDLRENYRKKFNV